MNKYDLITPCYILDENEFIHNITCFHRELASKFKNHIIGYSFKTNSLPRLLQLAKEQGCMAEVVSEDEYCLARKIGFSIDKIIYNGPIKTKSSFFEAVYGGAIVNVDSHRELEWCRELSPNENIGIRVNFDLESKVPGQTSTGNQGGRFGFCYENGELGKAVEFLCQNKITINSLHMHVSNASKSTDVYKELAEMACQIIKEMGLKPDYIDFGGGYFGGGDNGEYYRKYINVIYEVLSANGLTNIGIIVEPGASVVATAFTYLTQVVDVKDTTYDRFVFTDGTRLDIDPFMAKNKYVYTIYSESEQSFPKQTICGYTCMEKDRIMSAENATELTCGDYIEYKIVGSYTMGFNNLFINYPPNVYSKVSEEYVLVREKWGVDEYLRKNRWEL